MRGHQQMLVLRPRRLALIQYRRRQFAQIQKVECHRHLLISLREFRVLSGPDADPPSIPGRCSRWRSWNSAPGSRPMRGAGGECDPKNVKRIRAYALTNFSCGAERPRTW